MPGADGRGQGHTSTAVSPLSHSMGRDSSGRLVRASGSTRHIQKIETAAQRQESQQQNVPINQHSKEVGNPQKF